MPLAVMYVSCFQTDIYTQINLLRYQLVWIYTFSVHIQEEADSTLRKLSYTGLLLPSTTPEDLGQGSSFILRNA